jgi:hypothetical protein
MMKNYMISGAFAKGMKPEGESGGNVTTPFPEEDAVMSIYDGPIPHESWLRLLKSFVTLPLELLQV